MGIKTYENDYNKYEQYSDLLEKALVLSETLMLNEKAAKGEDVVISLKGKVVKIPAQDILNGWDSLMDIMDLPLWKVPKKEENEEPSEK